MPLAVTDTSPCNAKFGDTHEENLKKIDSYKFPVAKAYIKKLLPDNFQFHEAKYFVQGHHSDSNQSLPSIPALVTACSANHFSEAMELVENINSMVRPGYKDIKFFFYDMGLTNNQRKKVGMFTSEL